MQTVLRCHMEAFAAIGGVPNEILYDRMKTAVIGEAGGSIVYNRALVDFARHYGYQPKACRPYRAKTKGKVERPYRYIREDFFLARSFRNLDDLNAQLGYWLDSVANPRVPAVSDLLREIRPAPLPTFEVRFETPAGGWFTAAQKAELWERWKNGQSAAAISRALERKNKTGVERIVVLHGGIGPAPRRRALAALRFEEREEISRGIAVGRSIRQIAQGLGRAPSTVSREIRRNGGSQAYRANRADRRARERALRPKPCRLALYSALRWRVAQKLALQWSPQQISGWLKQEFPTHQDMQISHEAIYRSLFIQTRGVLKKELAAQLRTARRMRHPKSHNAKSGQGHILDMVSIRERPAEIEDRAVPGHWEGDLLTGANDTHIATLVERNTRFTMLIKIPRKDTTTVVAALAKHISQLPEELRRSLTWDQGKEMHAHKRFTVATNVQVYFCDPRSPWQRGSNENTNGLLRQYLPRGTDFSRISQSYLNAIALRLNQRPRKTLGFQTPADRLQAVLH